MRVLSPVIALLLVCLGGVPPAGAQDASKDPSDAARFHFGPLAFTPSIALSNVGVDSNVFNEADNPKSDTTAAVGPAVDLWMRMGRSRLSGKASGQYLYFKEYDNQRSWTTVNDGRWELPLIRIAPFATGSYIHSQDRPGYEIDARARREDRSAGAGVSLRLSSKTQLVMSGKRIDTQYDENQTYEGVDLAEALNMRTDNQRLDLRMQLTPLTTFVVRSEALQDRFDTATERDSNSIRVMPGFELRPKALISGEAFVGVRRFEALSFQVPDYTGIVATVQTAYKVRATRVGLKFNRDLAYSYEVEQPYYALTDRNVEVTERVTSHWDVVGRVGFQTLAYRNVAGSTLAERTDHSWQTGGGVGYRVGETLRLGFDANYYRRDANTNAARNYDGLRMGASVSYGLPQ